MAIRLKASLRAAIDTVFASRHGITAAQARVEFRDWVDSLLSGPDIVAGAGITASQGSDGSLTISAGGAAAAVGIPSFVADSAAQPSDDVLTAVIPGLANSPPFPSLVYLLTLNGLDRSADDLELRINGDTSRVRSLVDFRGDPLKARDLDPGALYEILAHASPAEVYRLTEPIPVRLPDWDLVFAWSAGLLTQAEADSGTVLPSPAQFTFPDNPPAPASLAWLGVPNDGRPILSLELHGSGVPFVNIYRALADHATVPQYGGADYTWVSLSGLTAADHGTAETCTTLSGLSLFRGVDRCPAMRIRPRNGLRWDHENPSC